MRYRILGLLLLASLISCGGKQSVQAPDFELKDLTGKTVKLSSFKGHPVLLDFWATWCGPCRMSIPFVQQFYMAHKDEGLVVLGMNVDEDHSGVYSFVKHFGMTYPVLYAGDESISQAYNLEGIPSFVFIDKNGFVTRRFDGFDPRIVNEWDAEFQRQMHPPK